MKVVVVLVCVLASSSAMPAAADCECAEPTKEIPEDLKSVSAKDGHDLLDDVMEFASRVQGHVDKIKEGFQSGDEVSDEINGFVKELTAEREEADAVWEHFQDKEQRLEYAGIEGNNGCRVARAALHKLAEEDESDSGEEFLKKVAATARQEAECIVGNFEAAILMMKGMKEAMGPDASEESKRIWFGELMYSKREEDSLEHQGMVDMFVGASVAGFGYGMRYIKERVTDFVIVLHGIQENQAESSLAELSSAKSSSAEASSAESAESSSEESSPDSSRTLDASRTLEALRELLLQARVLSRAMEDNKHLLTKS